MRLSFRAKLNAIVGTAAFALIALIVAGAITSSRTESLADIQQRHLPKLELGPKLEGEFDRLQRALQDAVAAPRRRRGDATRELEDKFLADPRRVQRRR